MKFKGLYTALVTPFTSEGTLDQEGLRENLRYQVQHRVQGIVLLGTTGESPTLSPYEKQMILEIALEEVKGKAQLIVGTGTYSTAQTIMQTQSAKDMGADAALIITPYYNKPTQEGLYRHFAEICEATSFPICIYNNQARTCQNLQVETLRRLAHFPSIIAIKESSGNLIQMTEIIELLENQQANFQVISGDDIFTFPLISLGGHGIISVASNLIPGPMQQFVQCALAGDFIRARQWHYQLLPLFKALSIETNPIPIKAAMQFCQMAAGRCRLPLCDLDPTHFQNIKEIINNLSPAWLGGVCKF